MTGSDEPTRSTLRGKWATPKRRRGKLPKAHLMSTDNKTFCGKSMNPGEVTGADWDPEAHPDNVCPRCLEWYLAFVKPKPASAIHQKASTST